MNSQPPHPHYHLFDGIGVELEYAIVDCETLSVRPLADALLRDAAGQPVNELTRGETRWSNELVQHVIEIKSNGPASDLKRLWQTFAGDVQSLNEQLAEHQAQLMPTAMHPLMVPEQDTRLWPHGQREIYETYDRIFDCRGHGWSNLQSMHLNFPFADDSEFERLHAAIRLVLPFLPALAASSPIVEGRVTGKMDTRLWHYRQNQRRLPIITSSVIPEPAFSEAEYHKLIFDPVMNAVRPLDPDEILEAEWLNSRGAIARFSRGAIEIRLLDVQECPRMDLTVAAIVVETVRALVQERWQALSSQKMWEQNRLASMLFSAMDQGSDALFADSDYAPMFGLSPRATSARRLLEHLVEEVAPDWAMSHAIRLVEHGCLAKRITAATGPAPTREQIQDTYRELCQCLADDQPFLPA